MAAVPSLSEKPVTTTTKELQSSGDSHPVVRRAISLRPDLLKMMARYFDKNTQQMPYGLVQLVVDRVSGNDVECTVTVGGELRSRKGHLVR